MAATKRNYFESGGSGGGIGGDNKPSFCVNFLTTEIYSAEHIVVYAKRLGSFTSVTAYLHDVDGANKPTGVALATSQTIPGDEISTDAGVVTFTFDTPYTVATDTQYAIVITVAGGSNYNWFDWWIYNYGGYRRGTYSSNSSTWTMYGGRSHWYQVWGSDVVSLTLTSPEDETANMYLNEDWLLEMVYADEEFTQYSDYTVHFDGVAQNDRSRYSILSLKMWLGITLEYETTYEWFVRKDLGDGAYLDSETWSFTTLTFAPPENSTRERIIYGEELWDSDDPPGDEENTGDGGAPGGGGSPGGGTGETETIPSGENNQITVQRLIAAVKNTIFYENK